MIHVVTSDAVLFALGAAAATTVGLAAAAVAQETTRRQAGWFAAFAAGALVSVALLHLVPEALELAPGAAAFMLAGFAGAYFLNSGVLAFAPANGDHHYAGLIPFLAIAFHSFIDGLAYAVTFSIDFRTGFLTVIGLIFHEVPEGIIVFTLLQLAGFSNRQALILAFLGAAATTPIGALAGQLFLADLPVATLGGLFAVTAGVLLYIGTSHLLPHVNREPLVKKTTGLVLGGLIAFGAHILAPHDHGHHDGENNHDHENAADHNHDHEHDHDHDHNIDL